MATDLQNLARWFFKAAETTWTNTNPRPDQHAQPVLDLIGLKARMHQRLDSVPACTHQPAGTRLGTVIDDADPNSIDNAQLWLMLILGLLLCLVSHQFALAQPLPPGATFRDCPTCPEMVVIPPGTFMMGSTEADNEREKAADAPDDFGVSWFFRFNPRQRAARAMAHEHPQHRVEIATRFALGKYPVTVGEFAEFVAETHRSTGRCVLLGLNRRRTPIVDDAWQKPGFFQTAANPVVCVSWRDATAYVAWLNKKIPSGDGLGDLYRLPTEAEWEYAARAGTTTSRWWGNEIGNGMSWCDGCGDPNQPSLNSGPSLHTGQPAVILRVQPGTIQVRWFPPNPFGLLGMPGNVSEWVDDCWHGSYEGAPSTDVAWLSRICGNRVTRGGAWSAATWLVRSASRYATAPDDAANTAGFRIARRMVSGGSPAQPEK